jgi:Yeast cortical protein KAR9
VKPKATTKDSSSPNSSQNVALESTSVIDQALINLDERLEAVSRSVEAVEEGLTPLLRSVKTPTQNQSENVGGADKLILRKHGALLRDWETVQTEAEVLREELKEDKWLTVFRSVSEQADGMMKSLEKAVTQCQVRQPLTFKYRYAVNFRIAGFYMASEQGTAV